MQAKNTIPMVGRQGANPACFGGLKDVGVRQRVGDKLIKSLPIKVALRQAIRFYRTALDTSNKELMVNTRSFIREHFRNRHKPNFLYYPTTQR